MGSFYLTGFPSADFIDSVRFNIGGSPTGSKASNVKNISPCNGAKIYESHALYLCCQMVFIVRLIVWIVSFAITYYEGIGEYKANNTLIES